MTLDRQLKEQEEASKSILHSNDKEVKKEGKGSKKSNQKNTVTFEEEPQKPW